MSETCGDIQVFFEEEEECKDCTSVNLDEIVNSVKETSDDVKNRKELLDKLEELGSQLETIRLGISSIRENKQDKLICGINIKTINGNCLLGYGNLQITYSGGECPFEIGSMFFTVDETDPSEIWEGTTWERVANGRTTIGVDESDVDINVSGLEIGEKEHTLILYELKKHKHTCSNTDMLFVRTKGTINSTADTRKYTQLWDPGIRYVYMATSEKTITTVATTKEKGGDLPHNNIQPSFTCYIYKRLS